MRKIMREFFCWHNWLIVKNAVLEVSEPKQNAIVAKRTRWWAYPREYRRCLNCGREEVTF